MSEEEVPDNPPINFSPDPSRQEWITFGENKVIVAGTLSVGSGMETNATLSGLASGIASSSTFLRGDRIWAIPSGSSGAAKESHIDLVSPGEPQTI